jgi:hypothetical protein
MNYDSGTGRAANSILLIAERKGVSASCIDCFAQLEAGIKFESTIAGQHTFPFVRMESLQVWCMGKGPPPPSP